MWIASSEIDFIRVRTTTLYLIHGTLVWVAGISGTASLESGTGWEISRLLAELDLIEPLIRLTPLAVLKG